MISIVCPVYNTSRFLQQAIESVLEQTYIHWELLLIDDGSTDDSSIICQDFAAKDKRIKYFKKENGGQASARNLGISKASFEWIAFLDSDDYWHSHKLTVQAGEISMHCPDFLFSASHDLVDGKLVAHESEFGRFTGDEFFAILYRGCPVYCNTVVVSKEVLNRVGGFDEGQKFRGVEDWDLWLRVTKSSKVVYGSPECLAVYRIHGGGIHHQMARMFIGKWQIYRKYENSEGIPRLVKRRQYRYVFRELLNHLYLENRVSEMREYMTEFLRVDKLNPTTLKQFVLMKVVSPKVFYWISNKIIYRIAYRLEYLTYLLFVPKKFRS